MYVCIHIQIYTHTRASPNDVMALSNSRLFLSRSKMACLRCNFTYVCRYVCMYAMDCAYAHVCIHTYDCTRLVPGQTYTFGSRSNMHFWFQVKHTLLVPGQTYTFRSRSKHSSLPELWIHICMQVCMHVCHCA